MEVHQRRGPFQQECWFLVAAQLRPRIPARPMPPICPSLFGNPAVGIWAQTSAPWKILAPHDDSMVAMETIGFQFVSLVNIWDGGYSLIGFWFGSVWSGSGHLLYPFLGYCSEDVERYMSLQTLSIVLTSVLIYTGSRSVIFRYLGCCRRYTQAKKKEVGICRKLSRVTPFSFLSHSFHDLKHA